MCVPIEWIVPPKRQPGFGKLAGPKQLLLQDLHNFFVWNCLSCDGRLRAMAEIASGICRDCENRLPVFISPLCRMCGISLSSEDDLCLRCRNRHDVFEGVELLRSACLYSGIGQDIMQITKSDSGRRISVLWARMVGRYLEQLWEPGMAIISSPPNPKNLRQRGFDQVQLIMENLAMPWRVSTIPGLLYRVPGQSQKDLDREGRSTNLLNRIKVRQGHGIPARVLLLDDVCTTGATLSACAMALRGAGCRSVTALTVFRD